MLRILAKYGGSMGFRRALERLTPSGLEEAAREMGLGPTALLELVCPDDVTSDGIRYGLDKEAKLNELARIIDRRLSN